MRNERIFILVGMCLSILFVITMGVVYSGVRLDLIENPDILSGYKGYQGEGVQTGTERIEITKEGGEMLGQHYDFQFNAGERGKRKIMQFPGMKITSAKELMENMPNVKMIRYINPYTGKENIVLADSGFGRDFVITEGEWYEVYFKDDSSFTLEIE